MRSVHLTFTLGDEFLLEGNIRPEMSLHIALTNGVHLIAPVVDDSTSVSVYTGWIEVPITSQQVEAYLPYPIDSEGYGPLYRFHIKFRNFIYEV